MFRLYNVNDPKKLAKLAAECKGNVEVEFNRNEAVNMKEAGAESKVAEMLKRGMRNIIVVLVHGNIAEPKLDIKILNRSRIHNILPKQ